MTNLINTNFDWKETIYSDGTSDYLSPENAKIGDTINVKLRLYNKAPVSKIFFVCAPDGERQYFPMKKIRSDNFFSYWQYKHHLRTPVLSYKFLIYSEENEFVWYNQVGLNGYPPPDPYDFRYYADFRSIEWLRERIFYQIFPDRFYEGNPSIGVKNGEYTYCNHQTRRYKWEELPKSYEKGHHLDFYGGDLEGITQKIDYFKELGVNALYLNPIFLSPSNHKYDTQDFFQIDPHLGTNEDFSKLSTALHDNNIKIILDGVFNHVGISHKWFNKSGFYESGGAYNDPNSIYRDYFTFYNNKDEYECWFGVDTLPKLNYNSQKLREEIYKGTDSVSKFWINPPYNIDGWRLDVANMLARQNESQLYKEVWREFRQNLKSLKPDCYIMGEHFFDPTDILQGDMLDGVMNYQGFYFPILKWLQKPYQLRMGRNQEPDFAFYDAYVFSENLNAYRGAIGWQIQEMQYNLLGCHDTPRLFSLLDKSFDRYKMAVLFLMTYPGVPSIYYGDEIGIEGLQENETRCCMVWDRSKWNMEIYNLYQTLINLRKKEDALNKGSFKVLMAEGNTFAYSRMLGQKNFVIILNNDSKSSFKKIPLWKIGITNEGLYNHFDNKTYSAENHELSLELLPYSAYLFETKIS